MADTETAESWRENLKTVFWAILIALIIRSFLLEPFRIPSGSMYPTLRVGDYLFVSKYSYGYSRYSFPAGLPLVKGRIWYSQPQRGDVVVFKFPKNPNTDFIGRIAHGFLVIVQESVEVPTQLTGNDILPELLLDASFVILSNFDDAIDVTIDVRFVDILKFHGCLLLQ